MNKLVLIGLAAALCLVAVPTASAHYVVASYPDPATGECETIVLPGSEGLLHGGALVSVGECQTWHT